MSFVSFIQTETLWDNWTIAGLALLIGLEIGYRFAGYQYVAAWSTQEVLLSDLVRLAFLSSWVFFAVCNEANRVVAFLAFLGTMLFLAESSMNLVPKRGTDLVAQESEVEDEDESDDGYRRYYVGHHYDPRYESDYESDHDYTQSKFL